MKTATLAFSLEEILALAQAAQTFSGLLTKIHDAAPDAWPDVTADFKTAADDWIAPVVNAAPATLATAGASYADAAQDVAAVHATTPAPVVTASLLPAADVLALVQAGSALSHEPIGTGSSAEPAHPADFIQPLPPVGSPADASAAALGIDVKQAPAPGLLHRLLNL